MKLYTLKTECTATDNLLLFYFNIFSVVARSEFDNRLIFSSNTIETKQRVSIRKTL